METKALMDYLAWSGAVEYTDFKKIISFEEAIKGTNNYFCAGMDKQPVKRSGDDDFMKKKYFVIDIDIRENIYSKTWKVVTDEELTDIIVDIIDLLQGSNLNDFCAYATSWNGLHLYYVGTERAFDKTTYSNGIAYIHQLIDASIHKTWCYCDTACKNLARLIRIPWSYNSRTKIKEGKTWRDLEPIQCELRGFEPRISKHFEKLEEYAELYQQQKAKEKADRQNIKQITKNYKQSNVWGEINKIPVWTIAEEIWWVTLIERGLESEALHEGHKNMWAYWYRPHNVIVNTGSSLIQTDKKTFTTYELVLYEKFNWDKEQTLDYFKNKWFEIGKQETKLPKKEEYNIKGYVYPWEVFDPFECMMSWELAIVVAQSNSWKTTFAMNMLLANEKIGKKWFYINLEFSIETVAKERRLSINGLSKRYLTDLEKLTTEQQIDQDRFVKKYLAKFDYYNEPKGLTIQDLVDVILQTKAKWYELFVIDSFSRILGNIAWRTAHWSQNKTMELLQELCQNTWVCIVVLHHTNKSWLFEGSQKIMDLSNVFITITRDNDPFLEKPLTKFVLTKDKFVRTNEIETQFVWGEYLPLMAVRDVY